LEELFLGWVKAFALLPEDLFLEPSNLYFESLDLFSEEFCFVDFDL